MRRQVLILILIVGTCLAVGILSSLFMTSSIKEWYPTLVKPSFTPPSWIFGPVWTVLYIMMGVAAFIVSRHGWNDARVRNALVAFAAQLSLNALWTPAFFGLRSTISGLAVIVTLVVVLFVTTISFFRISRLAGWLMLPYLAWASFAAVLNASIFWFNR